MNLYLIYLGYELLTEICYIYIMGIILIVLLISELYLKCTPCC